MPTLALNRQAKHEYEILEQFEAGIELTGAEVKSAKNGQIQIQDAFVRINPSGEAYLHRVYIAPYKQDTNPDYDPNRPRKLLLHQYEIDALQREIKGTKLTIIPLKVYTIRRSLIKVEIALARRKKQFEKRRKELKKDARREIKKNLTKY